MKIVLNNNGNSYNFGDNYFGGGNHSMIFYKDISSIYFDKSSSEGFLSKLLGLSKGTLTIKYKQFIYSKELTTVVIIVKSNEFDFASQIVETVNKAIIEEKENQKRIKLQAEKKLEKEKKRIEEFNTLLSSLEKVNVLVTDEKCNRQQEIVCPYDGTTNITKKTNPKKYKDFVVIDTETTGIKTGGNDIIEVSAIKFIDCKPQQIFTTLLKPRKPIPSDATKINGITNELVESSPLFGQIKKSLENFIGDYPIVAHNASFDMNFLFVSGLEFKEKVVFFDTLELSRKHIKTSYGDKLDNYKLMTVCNQCDIFFDGAHRSSADALATGLLFIEIIKEIRDNYTIEELLVPSK